jgi:hypothetical protein
MLNLSPPPNAEEKNLNKGRRLLFDSFRIIGVTQEHADIVMGTLGPYFRPIQQDLAREMAALDILVRHVPAITTQQDSTAQQDSTVQQPQLAQQAQQAESAEPLPPALVELGQQLKPILQNENDAESAAAEPEPLDANARHAAMIQQAVSKCTNPAHGIVGGCWTDCARLAEERKQKTAEKRSASRKLKAKMKLRRPSKLQ